MKKIAWTIGLGLCAFGLASCGSKNTSTVSGTPVVIRMGAASLGGMAYAPASTIVPKGTTVVWSNSDSSPHTVTSGAAVFDSGTMNPGATFSYTFATSGTFDYHCNFHTSMTANVVVQ